MITPYDNDKSRILPRQNKKGFPIDPDDRQSEVGAAIAKGLELTIEIACQEAAEIYAAVEYYEQILKAGKEQERESAKQQLEHMYLVLEKRNVEQQEQPQLNKQLESEKPKPTIGITPREKTAAEKTIQEAKKHAEEISKELDAGEQGGPGISDKSKELKFYCKDASDFLRALGGGLTSAAKELAEATAKGAQGAMKKASDKISDLIRNKKAVENTKKVLGEIKDNSNLNALDLAPANLNTLKPGHKSRLSREDAKKYQVGDIPEFKGAPKK